MTKAKKGGGRKRKKRKDPADKLRVLLERDFDYVEVVDVTSGPVKARIRFRVFDDDAWLPLVTLLLREAERSEEKEKPWALHICRQYILRQDTGKTGYIWNLIVQSEDLHGAVADIDRYLDLVVNGEFSFQSKRQRGGGNGQQAAPYAQGKVRRQRGRRGRGGWSRKGRGKDQIKPPIIMAGEEVLEMPLRGSPTRNRPKPGSTRGATPTTGHGGPPAAGK